MLNLSTIRITDVTEGAGWSPAKIASLRNLIEVCGLSAQQAAMEMSAEYRLKFTRSQIIGKCKRASIMLTTKGRGGRTGPKGGPSQKKVRKKVGTHWLRADVIERKAKERVTPPSPYVPACDPMAPGTVRLVDLEGCKWPTGDGSDAAPFLFCNAEPLPGLPYCGCHAALAFRDPEPRTRPSYR